MIKRMMLSAVAATALLCGSALAQEKPKSAGSASATHDAQTLPQQLAQKLKSQGFSDVQVVPGSFLVSAKDKDADPVTMIIGPHSMTVFTIASADGDSTTGSGDNPASGSASGGSSSRSK